MYAIWVYAIVASLIIGFSKAGFKGLGFIIVPLMALAFESKASTGVLLPLLMAGDLLAVIIYRRDANWPVLIQLFIPMAAGVLIGVYVGDNIPVRVFKQVMAAVVILSGILIIMHGKASEREDSKQQGFCHNYGLGSWILYHGR